MNPFNAQLLLDSQEILTPETPDLAVVGVMEVRTAFLRLGTTLDLPLAMAAALGPLSPYIKALTQKL